MDSDQVDDDEQLANLCIYDKLINEMIAMIDDMIVMQSFITIDRQILIDYVMISR